ncbi:MAG: prepilin-type N-terminal cleavage/methylation domain-containing protein, partial [Candidatus Omnitrophota bacterium]
MRKFLKNNKGFTFIEVVFSAATILIIIGAILSAWLFTRQAWVSEQERTHLRVDLMKALETIKSDMRLSDLNNMSFYP